MIGEHSEVSDVLLELVASVVEVGADEMEIEYNRREDVLPSLRDWRPRSIRPGARST